MRKNDNLFILGVLILMFLSLRLLVLFTYMDKLYDPEELYQGTIAREIIKGPLISLWEYLDYRVEYFPGGALTVGILAAPYFLLFGQTYIALKLVGLSFALGTLILWYLFLDRFFNRKTAIISSLLFIFCMPFYTKTSLTAWGSHPETNLFSILSLYLFYKIFFREDKIQTQDVTSFYQNSLKPFFFLGIVSGFGLWFVQTYLLTILFIFFFWFIFDKRLLFRKVFYIFCFGFLLGLSPAVYYALFYKGNIFNVNGYSPFSYIYLGKLEPVIAKLFKFFSYDLPNSFLFKTIFVLNGKILSYLYYFIFLIAFVYLLWLNRKSLLILFRHIIYPITLKEIKIMPYDISRESLILTFPLLFFIIYTLGSYSISPQFWGNPDEWLDYIGYRYIIPIIPFILVIIGIFIEKIRNKKIIFNIFLSSALGLGLIGNLSLISLKKNGNFNKDKGYSYNMLGDKIGTRIVHNLGEYIKPFDKLEPNLKLQFYEGLGAGLAWRLRDKDIGCIIKIFESEIKPEYRPYVYGGWGNLFLTEWSEELEKAFYIANNIPSKYRPFFYEGLGKKHSDSFDDMKRAIDCIGRIENDYKRYFYKGVGYSIGFWFKADKAEQLKLINIIDKKYHKFVYQGLSLGIKER